MQAQQAIQGCAPTMFFDCAQEVFRLTTEAWLTRALDAAQTLFLSLALLEIVVTGYMVWVGRNKQGGDLISQFALKIGLLAFVLGLISTYHRWLPMIAQGFGETAVYIGGSGVTHLSPTHLLNIGLSMLLTVMQSVGLISDVVTSLAVIPASLCCYVLWRCGPPACCHDRELCSCNGRPLFCWFHGFSGDGAAR